MTQIRCVCYAGFKRGAMSIRWMEQSLNKFSLSAFDICTTHCAHHIALRYGDGGRRKSGKNVESICSWIVMQKYAKRNFINYWLAECNTWMNRLGVCGNWNFLFEFARDFVLIRCWFALSAHIWSVHFVCISHTQTEFESSHNLILRRFASMCSESDFLIWFPNLP